MLSKSLLMSYTSTATDPNISNVVLLLHGEGVEDGTVIADSTNKNIITNTNCYTSSSAKKFGQRSIYFSTGSYLNTPNVVTDVYNFGIGDFTIETFVLPGTLTSDYTAICDMRVSAGGLPLFFIDKTLHLGFFVGPEVRTTNTLVANQWNHIAATRSNGIVKLFINGIYQLSYTYSTNIVCNRIYIGRVFDSVHSSYIGFMDEYRITKGVARYISDFTVPTEQFSDS